MRYMNADGAFKVVSVAAMCTVHSLEQSRGLGEAIQIAIEASDNKKGRGEVITGYCLSSGLGQINMVFSLP